MSRRPELSLDDELIRVLEKVRRGELPRLQEWPNRRLQKSDLARSISITAYTGGNVPDTNRSSRRTAGRRR